MDRIDPHEYAVRPQRPFADLCGVAVRWASAKFSVVMTSAVLRLAGYHLATNSSGGHHCYFRTWHLRSRFRKAYRALECLRSNSLGDNLCS